jgi:hypothetical protein
MHRQESSAAPGMLQIVIREKLLGGKKAGHGLHHEPRETGLLFIQFDHRIAVRGDRVGFPEPGIPKLLNHVGGLLRIAKHSHQVMVRIENTQLRVRALEEICEYAHTLLLSHPISSIKLIAYPLDRPIPKREYALGSFYSVALIWLNYYICRELFHSPAGSMGSMHGYWVALAERAQGSWFHPSWWPYWSCGMPFEFAYAPLVPALTAAWAAVRHVPASFAYNAIDGLVYIAAPIALFLMAWTLSRSATYSFFAALLYSLTAPGQLILPDDPYSLANFWQSWRFTATTLWDETPHLTAVTLSALAIAFLWLSITRSSWWYRVGAAVTIALATYASVFAPIGVGLACLCLIAAMEPTCRVQSAFRIFVIGMFAYALAAACLPPSLIVATRSAAQIGGEGWNAGSFTAIALILLGWIVLLPAVQRIKIPYLRFFVLFAYITSAIPAVARWLNRSFLPQPKRYRLEMEMALVLAIVFGLRPFIQKLRPSLRLAIVLVALAFAGEQIVDHRRYAKLKLWQTDIASTIEYRTAMWADRNLPGARIMLPGSIAQWAASFAPIDQYAGGTWSQEANPTHQLSVWAIFNGGDTKERDARVSLAWLKAFGAGAIAVSGPDSMEYWRPYAHPHKFDGVLPALWSESGVTIYRVPQRSPSLAHVIPASALVRRAPALGAEIDTLERYDAALEDPSLPLATFEWSGRNRIRILANSSPGQVVSVQVSYHPGWHAKSAGRKIPIHRDGLGLMWLESPGPSEIILDYDGGWELRLCRWLTYLALAALVVFSLWRLLLNRNGNAGRGDNPARID